MIKVFEGEESWEATDKAEDWLREEGYSVGTMQAGSPRGIKKGKCHISKWRNLSKIDIQGLDGDMTGNEKNGPVTVNIYE